MITTTKTKQGVLPLPKGGKYKQQDITGTKTIKETSPETVVKAAEYYFVKKESFKTIKSTMEVAKEAIITEMRKLNITQAKVYDKDGTPRRVLLKGEEKLKFEKAMD